MVMDVRRAGHQIACRRWARYARRMSFLALAALALLLLVVIAIMRSVYVKLRQARDQENRDPNARRHDSTLGELRDLREALGPLANKPNPVASAAGGGKDTPAAPRQPARSAR